MIVLKTDKEVSEHLRSGVRELINLIRNRDISDEELISACRNILAVRPEYERPVFPIQPEDKMAPMLIRTWIDTWRDIGGVPNEKLISAEHLLQQVINYQKEHGSKVPD